MICLFVVKILFFQLSFHHVDNMLDCENNIPTNIQSSWHNHDVAQHAWMWVGSHIQPSATIDLGLDLQRFTFSYIWGTFSVVS